METSWLGAKFYTHDNESDLKHLNSIIKRRVPLIVYSLYGHEGILVNSKVTQTGSVSQKMTLMSPKCATKTLPTPLHYIHKADWFHGFMMFVPTTEPEIPPVFH